MRIATPLHRLSLLDATTAIAERAITARALADAQLARIDETDSRIEAWATLDRGHVRAEADRCDRDRRHGLLSGVGIGVKDIIATRALPTQMGSPVYSGHRPDRDAACVTRLIDAGGYVFGKSATTELAFMQPAKTRNPWHAEHTPGGSSPGSAAAVAAGHVCAALGTQTNGSVIRPAAYCGVVGFKPTYGTIPFDGVYLFSGTVDTVGAFARSVADVARVVAALGDPGRVSVPVAVLDRAPRIALLRGFPWTTSDRDVDVALANSMNALRSAGAEIVVVTLPQSLHDAKALHRTITFFEAARNLGALQRRDRARLSNVLNEALDEGAAIAECDYRDALDGRTRVMAAVHEWLAPFDVVATLATTTAAPHGFATTGDPSCCTLFSLAGCPAIALPVAVNADGLPLAIQLAAPVDRDDRLLSIASWCERELRFVGLDR